MDQSLATFLDVAGFFGQSISGVWVSGYGFIKPDNPAGREA